MGGGTLTVSVGVTTVLSSLGLSPAVDDICRSSFFCCNSSSCVLCLVSRLTTREALLLDSTQVSEELLPELVVLDAQFALTSRRLERVPLPLLGGQASIVGALHLGHGAPPPEEQQHDHERQDGQRHPQLRMLLQPPHELPPELLLEPAAHPLARPRPEVLPPQQVTDVIDGQRARPQVHQVGHPLAPPPHVGEADGEREEQVRELPQERPVEGLLCVDELVLDGDEVP